MESVPAGASISLPGGKTPLTCVAPCSLPARPGIHVLHASAKGYQDWSGLVELKAGAPARVLVALQKLRRGATGELEVRSTLPAEIYIDGRESGRVTGEPAFPLAPGSYEITLITPARTMRPTVEVVIHAGKTTTTPLLKFR